MKKTLALILALSLVLGAMSGIAFAAEVAVTTVTDLESALANAQSGDVIILEAGEYEFGTLTLPVIDGVTIRGKDGAIIKNTVIKNADTKNDKIKNFTIDNITFENSRIYINGWTAGMEFSNWTITNCEFKNLTSATSIGGVIQLNLSSAMIVGQYGPYNDVALENFTFTNNIVDGAYCNGVCSAINSQAMEGVITIERNTFKNVEFNAVQLQNVPDTAKVSIKNNSFESTIGRQMIHINNNLADITIKDNSFVAKDSSQKYITHVSTTIDVSDNFFGILDGDAVVANANYADQMHKGSGDITTTGSVYTDSAVASVSGAVYFNLADAIAAAANGDTIDLLGNTVVLKDIPALAPNNVRWFNTDGKTLTIENGAFDLTGANVSDSVFRFTAADTHIVFNNVDFVKGEDGYVLYFVNLHNSSTSAKFNDCDFDIAGGFASFIANSSGGAVEVINADVKVEGGNFIYRGGALVKNVTFKSETGNVINHNAYPSVIDNSKIITKRLGFIAANGTIAITNGSAITAKEVAHYYAADNASYSGNLITVDATSNLESESIDMALVNSASAGTIVSKADSVYVQFAKTDVDAAGADTLEGADTYDIILLGGNAEKINELASADLSFVFDPTPVADGAMSYEITPAEGVTLTKIADRYMFNYDGVAKYEETGVAIKIGAVKFEGYGAYNFSTADVTTNAVYATEIRDNIVDGFEDAANLIINADAVNNDGMIGKIEDAEIKVPTRELTINIAFPNAVENNVKAYQAMSVRVVGGNYDETFALGTDGKDYNFELDLPYNTAYTVTVTGAGYRTARYTVTLNDNKTLNFWNNVMDEDKVVEVGKDSSKTKVTFLAGDIVKDNNINIYDLSAVVSYFATANETDKESDYAKYDLNRDGVIDSKDVAYVLVSWNN